MTKTRSTKRALLLSALSLLLCVSMLVGSTFAWFTDSVTSGNNKIQAGNLDVALYHGKGDPTNTVDTNTDDIFADVNGKDILWEPGVVAWTNLKVVNEGSLALKYQLAINFNNATANENGDTLAKVLKVGFIKDGIKGTSREAVLDEVSEWKDLASFVQSGTLNKMGQNTTYGIVVYWKPSAIDNEFNMNNGKTGTMQIDLGINLLATQLNAESDSFGSDYDAGLENSENGVSKTLDDGSTIFYYNEESGFGGRVRLTALPENLGNEYVVPAEVNDLGGALVGADLDKLTIPAGIEYAKKSLEGANIDEVIIADGATAVPNRMFYKANVKNIVIPETVTYIDENAFAMAGAETLTIPASVARVGEAAFQHMDNLKTVTIKGNIAIEGYAFRGCDVLRTVYLEGEDVSFVPSTLNGRNSTWFCNGESNNENTSNITFYVENVTVAERVKTAMGAEANNTPVYINEKVYVPVKNLTEFQNALDNAVNNTIISLTADITGDATAKQMPNIDVVIDGNGHTLTGHLYINGRSAATSPETLTIKNLHITSDYYLANGEYALINAYYEPTSGNGATRNIHNVTIEDCTFTVTGAAKYIAPAIDLYQPFNVKVIDCVVTGAHSVVQNKGGEVIYVEKVTATDCKNGISFGTNTKATIKNCDIKSVGAGGYGIRTDASAAYSLTVEDCKIEAFVPVLARKMTGNNYSAAFAGTNNVLSATNTYGYQVVLTETDWDNDSAAPKAPTGTYTLAGADSFAVFPAN